MLTFTEVDKPYKAIREGLFQSVPPRLLGSQCPACAIKTYPARSFCPHCRNDGLVPPRPVPLSPDGAVFAFTVIHQAPGGRKTPYVLALVDLDDQVRVLAQIHATPNDVYVGLRVSLVLSQVGMDDATPVIGYAFAPATAERGVQ